MANLRDLRLTGAVSRPLDLSVSLARCTQLTSLTLYIRVTGDATAQAACVLPSLTGLRALCVPASVVVPGDGACVASMTGLTQLGVLLPVTTSNTPLPFSSTTSLPCMAGDQGEQQPLERQQYSMACGLLQRFRSAWQVWPPGLQHVHFLAFGTPIKRWEFHQPASSEMRVTERPGGDWAECSTLLHRPCPHLPGIWEM